MRAWQRESYGTSCGRCNEPIAKGQPKQVLSGAGWAKDRCSKCADEPTPELPELEMPVHVEIQSTRKLPREDWRGVGALAVDYKLKQAGDR